MLSERWMVVQCVVKLFRSLFELEIIRMAGDDCFAHPIGLSLGKALLIPVNAGTEQTNSNHSEQIDFTAHTLFI